MLYVDRKESTEKKNILIVEKEIFITCKPNSRTSITHISKYDKSEIAKAMNRHPVDTLRNVGRENVIRLEILPKNPSKNVTR